MKTVTTANILTMIRGFIRDNLKSNGRDSFQYDTDTSFQLSQDYVSSATITVYINGTLKTITSDYTYNSSTNKVTITASLTKNDDVDIAYSYYEKYSDTELLAFIKCNLGRFVEHRYSKYFYINDDGDVVTLDGFDPTVEEANVIALITSVDIDPKNITVRTRDFTITSEQNKSKAEQINEIFSRWMRAFGKIDFLDEED